MYAGNGCHIHSVKIRSSQETSPYPTIGKETVTLQIALESARCHLSWLGLPFQTSNSEDSKNSHHPAFKLAFHCFLIARPRHAHSLAKILAKPLLPLHPTTVLLQLEPSLPPSLTTISHFHGISCRTVQFDDDQSSLEEKRKMSVVKAGGLHCSPFKIWWVLTSVDSMNKILCSAKLGNTFLTKTRCKGPQI